MMIKRVFFSHPSKQRLVLELWTENNKKAHVILTASDLARLIDQLEAAQIEMADEIATTSGNGSAEQPAAH